MSSTIFKIWASVASHLIGECIDLSKPYTDKNFKGLDPHVRFVSTQLFLDCHFTSESIFILLENQKEWDADLLCRSVLEGTLKYAYLMHGNDEDRLKKTNEYWEIMPTFMELGRNTKIKRFLDFFNGFDDPKWRPLVELLRPESALDSIRKQFNRKERQRVLQKWSFSEIGNYFAKLQDDKFHSLAHMAYGIWVWNE